MNLQFWKTNGNPKPEPKPKFNLVKFDFSMTLAQWRDSGNHLGWMRAQLNCEYGRQMIGVLINESPQHDIPVRREKLTDIQAAIELGRARGYAEAIETITLMTQPVVKHEEVEADFGAGDALKQMNYPERKR